VEVDLADGIDLCQPGGLDRIEGPVDGVVHLAGLTYVPDSFDRPAEFYRVNVNSALTVAEFCRRRRVATLIYLNTYVYGPPHRLPVDEEHTISLPSPYHRSKKLAEDLLLGYFGREQTRVVALRVFNLYGPYQEGQFLIPKILREAQATSCVTVMDLEPRRDYLYVADLVRLIQAGLERTELPGGVYNVGTGTSYSVAEVIRLVSALLARELAVRNLGQRRENEIMDCYADIRKAKRVFGWQPAFTLEEGLLALLRRGQHV
jgi:UDP-glucose 4-epimerase